MLIKKYVIREFSEEGSMIRPVAHNWYEGSPGEYLFGGDSCYDNQFESREDAEKAIYDFFSNTLKKAGDPMYIRPRFTVIELFGFESEKDS
jgi:hypothetical protein